MKIAFFSTKPWEEAYLKEHLKKSRHELTFSPDSLDENHLPSKFDADIISVFVGSDVNKKIINKFPNLKLITTRSTGFDHIDLKETKSKKIRVSTVPSYGESTVAEFTFALILAITRKIYDSYHQIRESGNFNLDNLCGIDLAGKTIGVVGTGKIGRHVIRIANGFEMNVIASDKYPDKNCCKELGFKYVSFDKLIKEADIITFHIPYSRENHHLLNKNNLKLVKTGAILINTSRGGIIETRALVNALKNGHLGGAGLDVLEEEVALKEELDLLRMAEDENSKHDLKTIIANHVLIDLPNVVITPHNAFNTKEALRRILETTIENIESFIAGKPQNEAK